MSEDFFVLLVGGATRNVGKTSLINRIIEKFSKENKIIALKIKSIHPGDEYFHGKDENPLNIDEKFRLIEETEMNASADAKKMLHAGAHKAFKLKVRAEYLEQAFSYFKSQINNNYPLIVESNSLRDYIKPAVFLLIKHANNNEMKPSAQRLEILADKIVFSNGVEHDFSLEQILLTKNGWKLM
jgi:GTPase SAR1 family protein